MLQEMSDSALASDAKNCSNAISVYKQRSRWQAVSTMLPRYPKVCRRPPRRLKEE